jgi:hypothetical protein
MFRNPNSVEVFRSALAQLKRVVVAYGAVLEGRANVGLEWSIHKSLLSARIGCLSVDGE